MNAERLLALYEKVAEAPDAVPRLRRFVLDLAVRGKLVPQDAGDEPASELLKRIAAEKARLVKAGGFREPRNAVEIKRDELPFAPPAHWVWARLIDISRPSYGFAFKSSQFNGDKRGMPLIRIRDISKMDTEAYYEGEYDAAYLVRAGDYLVGMDGDFNLRRWAGPDGLLNQRVMRINGWRCEIDPEFVKLPLQMVLDYLHGDTSLTTVKHLSAKQVNGIEIPLPPLAEQRRIVAKVEELMALLDRLEAARTAREATRDRLTAASLARLTAPDTDTAEFPANARFAIATLPALTTRPDQIKPLRQTILNLAVRGKLVDQDPTDEPVAELLAQDIPLPTGYTRRRKILKASSVDASMGLLGPLPLTWSYLTIQDLFDQNVVVDYADGNHGSLYPRSSEFGSDGVNFVSAKDLSDGWVNWQTCSKLNEERASQLSKGWAKTGDVLLTHNATVGRVARVIEDVEPFLLGTSVTFYRLNPIALSSSYFYYVLQSPVWQGQLEAIMAQTTRNQVSIQKQASFVVPLPPLAEQHRIVASVDALMALCDHLESSLTTATTTRSRLLETLLHEALSPGTGGMEAA